MNCLFCKIAKKEISSELIVYENGEAVAFLDIHPLSSGHTLVIPKSHAENIIDLPAGKIEPLFSVVRSVTEMIQRALSPRGFTIGINHGREAGQAVDHLHIHIIPRFLNDGGKSIHSLVNNPPREPLPELARKIKMEKQ